MVKRIAFFLVFLAASATLHAEDQGRLTLTGSAQWLQRTAENHESDLPAVGEIRFETDFDDAAGLGFALNYFFTDRLSVESKASIVRSDLALRVRTGPDSVVLIDLGDFDLYPLTVMLQYHFSTSGSLRPYVAAGPGYLILDNIETRQLGPQGVSKIEFDNSIGLVVGGGLNYNFSSRFHLNVDARYIPLESSSEVTFVGSSNVQEIDVRPLIVSAGLGYRF